MLSIIQYQYHLSIEYYFLSYGAQFVSSYSVSNQRAN